MADEKVIQELESQQESKSSDSRSPLHLIREKEMEISGRVLAAKSEAEDIIADARKKAVEMVSRAEKEGTSLAKEHEKKVLESVDSEVVDVRVSADSDIEALEKLVTDRKDRAVSFVTETVTTV